MEAFIYIHKFVYVIFIIVKFQLLFDKILLQI